MDPSTGLSMVQDQIAANNSWNAEQAQKQMDFQERMSNTAHQREVADLKASGLNPILSAKLGGASTPSGAMAQSDPSATSALVNMIDKLIDVTQTQAHGNYYSAKGNAEGEDSFTAKDIGSLLMTALTGRSSAGTALGVGKMVKYAINDLVGGFKKSVDYVTSGQAKEELQRFLNGVKSAGSWLGENIGSAWTNAKASWNNWSSNIGKQIEDFRLPYDNNFQYSRTRHNPGYFAGNNYPHIIPKKNQTKEPKVVRRDGMQGQEKYKRRGGTRNDVKYMKK